MNNIKISIIIPCYNVEKYIGKAIESIIIQSYKNWELILVNDGSTDNTLNILNAFGVKEKRIIIINSNNGGVSKARNLGLEKVSGNWLLFLDADDWYEADAFEKIVGYISKTSADIIGFNHYLNYRNKEWKKTNFEPNTIERSGNEIEWFKYDTLFPYYDQIKNKVYVGSIRGVWSKAFKMSIIKDNHINFIEGLKISEDAIFCLDVFNKAKKIILFNDYIIHHRIHSLSTMNKYTSDVIDINNFSLNEYLKRSHYFKSYDNFKICFLGITSECIFRMFKLYLLKKECKYNLVHKLKIIKDVTSSELYQKAIKDTTVKYLPKGKKQIIQLIKRNQFLGTYLTALISKVYLEATQRISK